MDAGKGVVDSMKDIKGRLSKHFDIVATTKESDFGVIVLGRGQGSTDLGYVGGFTSNDQGSAGGFQRASQLDYWVAASSWRDPDSRRTSWEPTAPLPTTTSSALGEIAPVRSRRMSELGPTPTPST